MFSFCNRSSNELEFSILHEYTEKCNIFKNQTYHIYVIKVNVLTPFVNVAHSYCYDKLFLDDFNDSYINELLDGSKSLNKNVMNNFLIIKNFIKDFNVPDTCKMYNGVIEKETLNFVFVFDDTQNDSELNMFIPFTRISKALKYESDMKDIIFDMCKYYFNVNLITSFKYSTDAKNIILDVNSNIV